MPVEYHLRSVATKLTLKKWLAAISGLDHMRPATEPAMAVNPRTGETISVPRETGDAEVYFPESDRWLPVFRWGRSRVSFNARPYEESPHLRGIVAELARQLGVQIVDDEGNVAE